MQTHLVGRDMITPDDWTDDEVNTIFEIAFDLKRKRAIGEPHALLRDKVLALMFFYSSTRTRVSFEAGMAQLGGHAEFIESRTTQIAHGDTAKEIGEIVGRYCDGIAIRHVDWGVGNEYVREVAQHSRVPVLNMQDDWYHPFQALADMMTVFEHFGRDVRGKTLNMSWAYASSYQKPLSVPQSVITLATRYGMNVRLTRPPEFKLMSEIEELAKENARRSGGSFEVLDDFDAGFRGAEVVYPKSWGATLTTTDMEESARIAGQYKDWIADERRMALTHDGIYLHCLPADRNIEVTDAVIDGPQSRVYDEAENRLHVQKAVMALTMR